MNDRRHLLVACGLLAVALVAYAWPVVADPGLRLVGGEQGSAWRALWLADATGRALGALSWPSSTGGLAFPAGQTVVSPSALHDLLAGVVGALAGPIAAHNLVMLGTVWVGGAGAWLLCRGAGASASAATVGAVMFGLAPYALTAGLCSGAPEGVAGAWVPWLLAALLKARSGSLVGAVGAVVAAVLVTLASPDLALMSPLLLPLVLLPGPHVPRGIGLLLGVATLGVLAGVGVLHPMLAAVDAPSSFPPASAMRWHDAPTPDGSLEAFRWVPGSAFFFGQRGDLAVFTGSEIAAQAAAMGWVPLGLAAVGSRRGTLRWLALGSAAMLLASGPYGAATPDAEVDAPGRAWSALSHLAPWLARVGMPAAASAYVYASVAVLASIGIDRIARPSTLAGVGVAAGVAAEVFLATPVPWPVWSTEAFVPPAVDAVRELPEDAVVLDWPPRHADGIGTVERYLYYQTRHRHRIPYDLSGGTGGLQFGENPWILELSRVTWGADWRPTLESPMATMSTADGRSALQVDGIGWLLLHPWHIDPTRRDDVIRWLDLQAAATRTFPDGAVLYRL